MLPTIELGIIVFTSLEGRAPSVSGEEAITKWTPGALSPGKSASRQRLVGHCWRVYRPSGFFWGTYFSPKIAGCGDSTRFGSYFALAVTRRAIPRMGRWGQTGSFPYSESLRHYQSNYSCQTNIRKRPVCPRVPVRDRWSVSGNPTNQELTMKCAKFGFHPPILILADSRSAPRTPKLMNKATAPFVSPCRR